MDFLIIGISDLDYCSTDLVPDVCSLYGYVTWVSRRPKSLAIRPFIQKFLRAKRRNTKYPYYWPVFGESASHVRILVTQRNNTKKPFPRHNIDKDKEGRQ